MILSNLVKRQEFNYPNEINFDSISNQHKLNYPVNKFIVSENINEFQLREQIKLHAVDYSYKSVDKLYLICIAFHSLDDFQNFNNSFTFDKCFDINSTDVKHFV
jgi:hypothetical protein